MNEVRIDKYLWAVRLFKTRARAADYCKKNKVSVAGQNAKPSRMIKAGDVIRIKKGPITLSFQVLAIAHNRMGAKLVSSFLADVTTKDQRDLIEMQRLTQAGQRQKGLGRPTKKERRDIERAQMDMHESQTDFDTDTWSLENFFDDEDEDDTLDEDLRLAPNNVF